MRFLHAVSGASFLLVSGLVVSCGTTGTEVDTTILHSAPETRGHVLFVSLHRHSKVGADGFPETPFEMPPTLVFLKRLDDDSSSYSVTLENGCIPEVRLLAWIDVNDTSGYAAMMEEGEELTPDSADPRFDLGSIARPDKGDWIALSAPIDAAAGDGACKPGAFDANLEPAPTL